MRDINNKDNIADNIANIDKLFTISAILVINNIKDNKDKDNKLSLANIIS